MFTRIGKVVNRNTECGFELCGSSVEIFSAIGAGLCREPDHRNERANMPGEPIAIDAQIDVRDTRTNPAAPAEFLMHRHAAEERGNLRPHLRLASKPRFE